MARKTVDLQMGPNKAGTIGPMYLDVRTDGEMVVWARPEVGYLHRGIEKTAERVSWFGFIPFSDRVDYLSSVHCNLAYALAVESLGDIRVPERASFIRIVASELNRIASHLLSIGSLAQSLGIETGMMYALRDRERINNLFEVLCGARLTYSYIRIGGVAADVTDGFIEKTYELVEYLVPKLKEYHDLLANNDILIGRLAHAGVVSADRAIAAGVSGPVLRAAGVRADVRKMFPYSGYHRIDFEIPIGYEEVGTLGDAFDRLSVRIHEIEQACLIIKQALDLLPEGPYSATVPRLYKAPAGEAYAAVESPRGLFGVYVSSTGDKGPYRLKLRTPSFPVLNLFPDVLKNVPLSDVTPIITSLDIMMSEVDR